MIYNLRSQFSLFFHIHSTNRILLDQFFCSIRSEMPCSKGSKSQGHPKVMKLPCPDCHLPHWPRETPGVSFLLVSGFLTPKRRMPKNHCWKLPQKMWTSVVNPRDVNQFNLFPICCVFLHQSRWYSSTNTTTSCGWKRLHATCNNLNSMTTVPQQEWIFVEANFSPRDSESDSKGFTVSDFAEKIKNWQLFVVFGWPNQPTCKQVLSMFVNWDTDN